MATLSSDDNSGGIYTVSGNLKEEALIKAQLEKNNFDLKMRVYYLEEKLTKLASGETGAALLAGGHHDDSLSNSLKLQVEEKNIELEQRNVLLLKAKTAIDNLKKEIDRNKIDQSKQQELEDRLRRLKVAQDEMDADYKSQISEIEQHLAVARNTIILKDQQRIESEGKIDSAQLALVQSEERYERLREEKDRMDEQWLHINHKAEEMEEEITQLRAHCDLYRMQVQEHAEEFEQLRSQNREAQQQMKSIEAQHAHKIHELNAHNTSLVAQLKDRHIADLEKEKFNSIVALQEARDAMAVDAARERSHHEAQLRESRSHDAKEVAQERILFNARIDDLMKRMDDKQEEINRMHGEERALRLQHEADRTKFEHALTDSEVSKVENKILAEQITQLKSDLDDARDELKHLRKDHDHGAEVKEGLRREHIEKNTLASKLEQANDALEKLRETLHEKEMKQMHDESEIRRLHTSNEEYRNKLHTYEEVVRENERSKSDNHTLKMELHECSNRNATISRELASAQGDMDHQRRTMTQMENEIKKLQDMYDALISHKDELHSSLHSDRSKLVNETAMLQEQQKMYEAKLIEQKEMYDRTLAEHKAHMAHFVDSHKDHAEGFMNENRGLVEALRQEIEHLHKEKLDHERHVAGIVREKTLVEKELQDTTEKMSALKDDIIKVFTGVIKSLSSWDDTLLHVIEGDLQYLMTAKVGSGGTVGAGGGHGSIASRSSTLNGSKIHHTLARKDRDRLVDPHAFVHIHDQYVTRVDDLMQDVAICTDRVQSKVDRAARLRVVFDAQAQRMLESVQAVLDVNLDKAQLLAHRLSQGTTRIDSLQQVLERDTRKRLKDEAEMQSFKQDVISEHTARLSGITQTAERLGAEKKLLEEKYRNLEEMNEALSVQVEELRQELSGFYGTETMVNELSSRVGGLGETNHTLSHQLEVCESALAERTKCLEDVVRERDSLSSSLSRTEHALTDSRGKCEKLLSEVDRLGKFQIHPSLAAVVLETQSMLQQHEHAVLQQLGGQPRSLSSPSISGGSPLTQAQGAAHVQTTPSSRGGAHSALTSMLLGTDYKDLYLDSPVPSGQGHGFGGKPSGEARHVNFAVSPSSGSGSGAGNAIYSTRQATPGAGYAASLSMRRPGSLTSGSGPSPYNISSPSPSSYSHPHSPYTSYSRSVTNLGTTPGGTAATPNTLARTSASRLTKLGNDLEALARKLDQFDGKGKV